MSATATPLLDYLDKLVEHLRHRVPTALNGNDVDAIHQARVATRRMKAAIELLDPLLNPKQAKSFNRTLRKLRRRLGPLRDADVMLARLAKLRRGDAVGWIEQHIRQSRLKAVEKSARKRSAAKLLGKIAHWSQLRADAQPGIARIDPLLHQSLMKQLEDFAAASDRLAANDPAAAPDPHQVRIAGKSLRYTLEMAKANRQPVSAGLLKTFKRMQDALGVWHDFIVLTERIQVYAGEEHLAHHDTKLQRDLLKLASVTLKRAERSLKKFGKLWTEQGTTIREAIVAITSASAVTPPRTDRDPSDSAGTEDPAAAPPASTEVA